MRVGLAFTMATLALAMASQPLHALQVRDDVSPLGSVRMIDAQIGWAVTPRCGPCPPRVVSGLLLRTTNGGTQWKDITPVDSSGQGVDVPYFHAFDSRIAWAPNPSRAATENHGIFRTVDEGRTWRIIAIPPGGWQSMSFINPREGWLLVPIVGYAGHTDVDIYRSQDGGETWIKVATNTDASSGLTNVSGMTGITFLNPTTGWITGIAVYFDWLYLYVTQDGGRTWRQQNLPRPPQPQRDQPLSQHVTLRYQASLSQVRFFTAHDGIMRANYDYYLFNDSTGDTQDAGSVVVFDVSHDGGKTWAYTTPLPVRQGNPRPRPSTFVDMNHGWVKDEDTLYVTNDGGRRWTRIRPNQFFADVTQLDFISPEIGWAVRNTDPYGGGARQTSPFLLKTLDGGRTWAPVAYTISRQ